MADDMGWEDTGYNGIRIMKTPKAYDEGGYEVDSSRLGPEAGKALVDAAIELVGGLR